MSSTEETNMQENLATMATSMHLPVLQQENKTIDETITEMDSTVPRTETKLDIVQQNFRHSVPYRIQ